MNEFASEISRHVWRSKYRCVDRTVSDGHLASNPARNSASAIAIRALPDRVAAKWATVASEAAAQFVVERVRRAS